MPRDRTPLPEDPSGSPVIRAAGGILWRTTEGRREVVIIHRGRYDDWTLPKGKLEPGESEEAAALREVEEETGYRARLLNHAGTLSYGVNGVAKVVEFWNMEPLGESSFQPSTEVLEVIWLPPREALAWLDHEAERELLRANAGLDS